MAPHLPNRVFSLLALIVVGILLIPLGHVGWYGLIAVAVFGGKLIASLAHRPVTGPAPDWTVAAVVPAYNEDPAFLRASLITFLNQTRPPDFVVVVDDGSTSLDSLDLAHQLAPAFTAADIDYTVVRQNNAGKRHALAAGFRAYPTADAYLCVDSDTLLDPRALEESMRPFADPAVTAVTGLTMAANHDRNLLTRLIDVRYICAFLVDRAAYSTVRSVLCCCGSLSVYRADVVHRHLDGFLGQTFLGSPATFGDDRHMTNLCLLDGGRVVLQETAVAFTAVPERLGHYARQQARWNRSFFRESWWVLQNLRWTRAMWLTIFELVSTAALTLLLAHAILWRPFHDGAAVLGTYLLWIALMGWVRSTRALADLRPGQTAWDRVRSFLLAPLYGLLTLFVVVPLRAWSLVTLTESKWGTRGGGVEVALDVREPVRA